MEQEEEPGEEEHRVSGEQNQQSDHPVDQETLGTTERGGPAEEAEGEEEEEEGDDGGQQGLPDLLSPGSEADQQEGEVGAVLFEEQGDEGTQGQPAEEVGEGGEDGGDHSRESQVIVGSGNHQDHGVRLLPEVQGGKAEGDQEEV